MCATFFFVQNFESFLSRGEGNAKVVSKVGWKFVFTSTLLGSFSCRMGGIQKKGSQLQHAEAELKTTPKLWLD